MSASSSSGAARSRAESIDSVGDASVLEKYADEYGEDDALDDDDVSVSENGDIPVEDGADLEPGTAGWQGRIDLVRKSRSSVKHLGKPRALRRASIGGKWLPEEDATLRNIVNEHGAKNWKKIAKLLGPTRTDVQCLHRWNKVLKPGLHKGAWSEAEDKIVREMVTQNSGEVKWSAIAARLPGRIGKQCRERWFNHLDPVIKRGDWSSDEDRCLFEAQRHFGNRWCEISKILPGRTENAVKNRWNSSTMRRWLKERELVPGNGQPLQDLSVPGGLERSIAEFHAALHSAGVFGIDASALLVVETDEDAVSKKRKTGTSNLLPPSSRLPAHLRPPGINTASTLDNANQQILDLLGLGVGISSEPSPVFAAPAAEENTRRSSRARRGTTRGGEAAANVYERRTYAPSAASATLASSSSVASASSQIKSAHAQKHPPRHAEGASPVSRSLQLLQGGVDAVRNFAAGLDVEPAPLSLLAHFRFLNDRAQKDIMRQLVERFQRTNATPRGMDIFLPTPRLLGDTSGSSHLGHLGLSGDDARLLVSTLSSPMPVDAHNMSSLAGLGASNRQALTQTLDPDVFENFGGLTMPVPIQHLSSSASQGSIGSGMGSLAANLGSLDDNIIPDSILNEIATWLPGPTPTARDAPAPASRKRQFASTLSGSVSGNTGGSASSSGSSSSGAGAGPGGMMGMPFPFTDVNENAVNTAVLLACQVISRSDVAVPIMKNLMMATERTERDLLSGAWTTSHLDLLPTPFAAWGSATRFGSSSSSGAGLPLPGESAPNGHASSSGV